MLQCVIYILEKAPFVVDPFLEPWVPGRARRDGVPTCTARGVTEPVDIYNACTIVSDDTYLHSRGTRTQECVWGERANTHPHARTCIHRKRERERERERERARARERERQTYVFP